MSSFLMVRFSLALVTVQAVGQLVFEVWYSLLRPAISNYVFVTHSNHGFERVLTTLVDSQSY